LTNLSESGYSLYDNSTKRKYPRWWCSPDEDSIRSFAVCTYMESAWCKVW